LQQRSIDKHLINGIPSPGQIKPAAKAAPFKKPISQEYELPEPP